MNKRIVIMAVLLVLGIGALATVVAQNMSAGETYLTSLSLLGQLGLRSQAAHAIAFRDTTVVASAPVATIWYQADPDGTGACGKRLIIDFDSDGTLELDHDGTGSGTSGDIVIDANTGVFNDYNCDGVAGD